MERPIKTVGETRLSVTLKRAELIVPDNPTAEDFAQFINYLESKRAEHKDEPEYQRRVSIAQTKLEEASIAVQRVYDMM